MATKTIKQFLIVVICLAATGVHAQQSYPVVGKPMPSFTLGDVQYFSSKTVDRETVKGKWLILDFWEKGCVACVQSFPKINQLQEEFKDNVQFMLIAKNDKKTNRNIDAAYAKYRSKLNLTLPIAYDSAIFEQFGIHGVPHVIVIDPQKNVYGITWGDFINRENLAALIAGQKPAFNRKFGRHETTSNRVPAWEFLIKDNETLTDKYLYRSLLSVNNGEPAMGAWAIEQYADKGYYQVTRLNLAQLYNVAYVGMCMWGVTAPVYNTHWFSPLLEVNDSSIFQYSASQNKGFYNYSIVLPQTQSSKALLMEAIQRDLRNAFGYTIAMETRMMPYWRLTATPDDINKLKSKSVKHWFKPEPTGIEGERLTIDNVLSQVALYNLDEQMPFIDETNITDKIDIKFTAVMTDMNDVVKALRKHGLILEKSKKEMQVLVIRDPEPDKL